MLDIPMSIGHASRGMSRIPLRCRALYRPKLCVKNSSRTKKNDDVFTGETRQFDAVAFVRRGDFDLGQFVQGVQLRQTQGSEAVDHRRVTQKNEIEPTATTFSAGRHAPLASARLQMFTDFLKSKNFVRFSSVDAERTFFNSVGKTPSPTRVVYALTTP